MEQSPGAMAVAFLLCGVMIAFCSGCGATPDQDTMSYPVACVAFSPDGKHLAACGGPSASADDRIGGNGAVWVWETGDWNRRLELKAFTTRVTYVSFSSTSDTLATASIDYKKTHGAPQTDGLLQLWNVADGRLEREERRHHSWMWCIAFSKDGKWVATSGNDGKILLYNNPTLSQRTVVSSGKGVVTDVAFSSDCKVLASARMTDPGITLWDLEGATALTTLGVENGICSCMASSWEGGLLGSGTRDGLIRIWDLSTREEMVKLDGHKGKVESMCFSKDGATLVSGGEDGYAIVWNVRTRSKVGSTAKHSSGVSCVAISPDGRIVATGCGSLDMAGEMHVWEARSGKEIVKLK